MFIYIYGETWVGKTHWAFENSQMCIDTLDNNERLFDKFKDKKEYVKLENIDTSLDIPDEVDTIALDTLYGLKELGKRKYLIENNKRAVYPPTEWGIVYNYMQDFLEQFEDMTVLITTRLKPLYNKEVIVGDTIDMPAIFEYFADIMLHMKIEDGKRVFGVYKARNKDPIDFMAKQLDVMPLTDLLKVLV